MTNVVDISSRQEDVAYEYHDYRVRITYRPRFNDFRWTIDRTISLTHSENAPTLDAAKRAANKYIDTIQKKRR